MYDEGKITPEMPPKIAYQQDPLFLKYKLSQFRAGLNKHKAILLGVFMHTKTKKTKNELGVSDMYF